MSTPEEIGVAGCDGFHLTRIRGGDKNAYLTHFTDQEIARNTFAIPFPYTEADADWWLAHCAEQARDPETRFAIREPSGYLIGAIGIVGELPASACEAEFGYWLARSHRGRGLMPRVIDAFADHAFRRLGLRRLYATPFSFNHASHRALEKAGFRRERLMREQYRKDGVYLDAIFYMRLAPAAAHT